MKQRFICTLLFCVIVLLFSITGFAQSIDKNAKGIWLYHVAPLDRPSPQPPTRNFDKKVYDYPGLKGVQLAFSCRKLQPLVPVDSAGNPDANGGFNWNYLDRELIDVASNSNLFIGILIWTGEDAPDWLYTAPYNIGKCNTNWKDTGGVIYPKYFPDYFNSGYSQLWYAMIDSVMHHLNMGPDSDEPDGDDDSPLILENSLYFTNQVRAPPATLFLKAEH